MNVLTIKQAGPALILAGVLAGCGSGRTPESTTAAEAPAVPTAASSSPPSVVSTVPAAEAEASSTPTPIPDTADAIWQAIDQQSVQLKATIQDGSLENVHHQAFAIRDLVAALPSHSPALPPEDQSKLQGEVKFVATLADRLDATGDAGDRAGAQENYDKLVAVLNGITRTK